MTVELNPENIKRILVSLYNDYEVKYERLVNCLQEEGNKIKNIREYIEGGKEGPVIDADNMDNHISVIKMLEETALMMKCLNEHLKRHKRAIEYAEIFNMDLNEDGTKWDWEIEETI